MWGKCQRRTAVFRGDAKQSIYRFRGAEPRVFAELRSELPEAGRLPLNLNFRSQPAILGFVNALFDGALGEDYEPLVATVSQVTPEPSIEFLFRRRKGNPMLPLRTRRRRSIHAAKMERKRTPAARNRGGRPSASRGHRDRGSHTDVARYRNASCARQARGRTRRPSRAAARHRPAVPSDVRRATLRGSATRRGDRPLRHRRPGIFRTTRGVRHRASLPGRRRHR